MARAESSKSKRTPATIAGATRDLQPVGGVNGGIVRIGFVPLIDAAPLVAAQELGLFERHGVRVSLERQIGWANVRDKLTYGHLDAGHALLGMPISSVLSGDWVGEPLISVMALGAGGNAITLSRPLVERGIRSAATLARWIQDTRTAGPRPRTGDQDSTRRKPTLAHVFGCSMHHYLLRDWLSAAGIDPDVDVVLCVIPPEQMASHMHHGHLDGYCVGEPYNTLAERNGFGTVVTPTADILPDHPEKVLSVTKVWAAAHGPAVVAMIKALLEACAWCEAEHNQDALAEMLSAEQYIGLPKNILIASLKLDRSIGVSARQTSLRPADWKMRSFSVDRTFPSSTHAAWITEQMIRWGHASSVIDVVAAARQCTDSRFYRQAAAELGLVGEQEEDFAPMQLRHGDQYDVRKSPYRGQQQAMPSSELVEALAVI